MKGEICEDLIINPRECLATAAHLASSSALEHTGPAVVTPLMFSTPGHCESWPAGKATKSVPDLFLCVLQSKGVTSSSHQFLASN